MTGTLEIHPLAASILREAGLVKNDYTPGIVNVLNQAPTLPAAEKNRVVADVARELVAVPSPAGAGILGIWFGSAVENGRDPEATCGPVVEALAKWLALIETSPDEDVADAEPAEELSLGLNYLGQACVAHLARCPDRREALRLDERLMGELARTQHLSAGAMWVREVLMRTSGELVVMHGVSRQAVRIAYRNISNCFHLFSLLQSVLQDFAGAQKADPAVVAAAHGEEGPQMQDNAWWHYGQPVAGPSSLDSSVWGEASPESIMIVGNQRVLLLWPPILSGRGWDSGFFGPHLAAAPSSVKRLYSLDDEAANSLWRTIFGGDTK